jgi:acyl-CoA synthetase (AMP-forming)/AMP-acid ligase II
MSRSTACNFAVRLLARASGGSCLIDAPTGQSVSARELPDTVASFAAGFLGAGLKPGDRLVLVCDVSMASALAYLGAIYAGIVPVPLHERTWATCGEALLRKTNARAVWSARQLAGCGDAAAVTRLTGLPRAQHRARAAACCPDDVAVLMPTSGSTGVPRIVMVSHRNLRTNTEAIVRSQRLGHDERAMLVLPLSYCFGASVLHTHLHQGGGVVFDPRFMFPDKVLYAIGEFGCTTFAGVPTAYQILLRRSNLRSIALKPLRRFLQAGGALAPPQVLQMRSSVPHADFFVMYGQTEATARISCLPPAHLADKLGSVGLPLDNVEVRVMDASGQQTRAGQPGTFWAAGDSVCRGYLDDREASAEKFRGGWLVTGDLGYRDEDGFLWISGRSSDFVKMRGVRVSFGEIEARVAAAPGVQACAAAAVPHEEAGEALALYVVAEPGAKDVLAAVRHSVPPEWVCASVSLVAALPLTAHGKLARRLLPRLAEGRR